MQSVRTAGVVAVLALAALAEHRPASAQAALRTPRVGVLSPYAEAASGSLLESIRQGLRELGHIEGRNIAFEHRTAEGHIDRLPELAAELVRRRVDVLVTTTSAGVRASRQATTTIPIVVGAIDDAVEQGFVSSLARPGGNITGTSWLEPELSAKRLQLLKETIPSVSRIAVLREAVGGASALRATLGAARVLGVQLQTLELREPNELESSFSAMRQERAGGLAVLQGPMIQTHMRRIVDLAAQSRLPAIFPTGRFVESGGLMSYGPNLDDMYKRAAVFVDKILRGAKPADLPVEQPTRFELIVNLRAAKGLGLAIPEAILVRADRVLQP